MSSRNRGSGLRAVVGTIAVLALLAGLGLVAFAALGLGGNPLPPLSALSELFSTTIAGTEAPVVVGEPMLGADGQHDGVGGTTDEAAPGAGGVGGESPAGQAGDRPQLPTAFPTPDATDQDGAGDEHGVHKQLTVSPLSPLDADEYAAEIFAESNAARAERGLPALMFNQCAQEQALARAQGLAGNQPLAHAPLGPVITTCNPPGLRAAENLLRGPGTPAEGVAAWLASPGHAANLLDPNLRELGIGCIRDDVPNNIGGLRPEIICSQIFLQ